MPKSVPSSLSKLQPLSLFATEIYVQQLLKLLELSVPSEQLPGVVENFDRIHTIAQAVLDFPLPDDLESAPTFEP